jgi:hypothetical protein
VAAVEAVKMAETVATVAAAEILLQQHLFIQRTPTAVKQFTFIPTTLGNTYGYKDNDYNGTYSITSGDSTNGTMDFTVVDHNGDKKGWETVSVTITNGVFYIHVWDNPAWVDANHSSGCYNYIKK